MALDEVDVIAEELQAAGVVGGDELCQEEASKQPREHAHRKEEAGPAGDPPFALERDAAAQTALLWSAMSAIGASSVKTK